MGSLKYFKGELKPTSMRGIIKPDMHPDSASMYLSAKVKMLEHASKIIKVAFQISKIILPTPEI